MKRGLPAWIGGGVLVALIALAFALQLAARAPVGVTGSVSSARDDGRRAAALLLARLGLRAEAWREGPGRLPAGAHAVWRATRAERPHVESRDLDWAQVRPAPPPAVGLHAPEHLGAFVARGGTVVVEGQDGLAHVRDVLGFEHAVGLEIAPLELADRGRARLATGERLRVAAESAFEPLDPAQAARELAVIETRSGDLPLVVEIPHGAGRALAIADGFLFDNGAIADAEHGLLLVRIAEEMAPGARILFDEHALGLWEPEGLGGVATRPSLLLLTLHLAAIGLAAAWLRAWPRAFPRDPEPLETFSPLRRARALARLAERARRVEVLVPAARAASLARVARARRLRVPRPSRDDGGLSRAEVEACARALPADLAARAVELYAQRPVATRVEFERLAGDLERFESDASGGGDRRADRGR